MDICCCQRGEPPVVLRRDAELAQTAITDLRREQAYISTALKVASG